MGLGEQRRVHRRAARADARIESRRQDFSAQLSTRSLDADKSTLELIMVAPMVVASWINLQYYGSTVNNRLFGSGNKVLHNVVGTFGVWQGNGGDLQSGLPLQSVHDGTRWMHEPLRLNVFIEAERSAIESIIAKQPGVRELVENGWVNLVCDGRRRQKDLSLRWKFLCQRIRSEDIMHETYDSEFRHQSPARKIFPCGSASSAADNLRA